jgi:Tol biopolymer transport system component
MTSKAVPTISIFLFAVATLLAADNPARTDAARQAQTTPARPAAAPKDGGIELPCHRIPNLPEAAEWYFSADGRYLIGNAKGPDDTAYHVYVSSFDGTDIRRINGTGEDACSFFFPDGKRVLWTSTRDWPDLPKGVWHDANDYPRGAEIYSSDTRGGDVKRLTTNKVYDAECVVPPNGRWILFGRQIDGKMDLWTMDVDGSNQRQITFTDDWQEGGAQILPDGETIVTRAWKRQDQGKGRGMMPMQIFTLKRDGSGRKQVTTDEGTHWAPYPAPDGRHFVYVRVLNEPGGQPNWEIYLRDFETGDERRLTFDPAFDGFPSISADGHWMTFSSGRGGKPGERALYQQIMDISSLGLGPGKK